MGYLRNIVKAGADLGSRQRGDPVAHITDSGRERLGRSGVPDIEWAILNHLADTPDDAKTISRMLKIKLEKVKRILSTLEESRYVSRTNQSQILGG